MNGRHESRQALAPTPEQPARDLQLAHRPAEVGCEFYVTADILMLFGISRATFYRWRRTGQWPVAEHTPRIGIARFRKRLVDRLIANRWSTPVRAGTRKAG
jgi:predicted DNA-binding transcriptional regulator AlpA